MKHEIYHETPPTFGIGAPNPFPDGFRAIAVIEASDVEDAYRLSQHGPDSWLDRDCVLRVSNGDWVRPTSVGDVIVGLDGGTIWRVGRLGMERLAGKMGVLA